MVPAAVIIIGNMRGSASAARITARYPARLAMEERARVIRGISSMENSEARRSR